MILGAPQDRRVEGTFVQVVEGRVGRRRRDDVAAALGQGIRQGDEMPVRLARREDAQGRAVDGGGDQGLATRREGGFAQADLFLGDGRADADAGDWPRRPR